MLTAEPLTIAVGDAAVSGLLQTPPRPRACYVLAHGAGAGMAHPFMARRGGPAERGIATFAISSSTWTRQQAHRSAQARPCRRPRRRRRGRAAVPEAAADRRRQIVGGRMTSRRRPPRRFPAYAGSRSSAFRRIRQQAVVGARRPSCSMCKSRCCSCKALAMRWPRSISSSRCAKLGDAAREAPRRGRSLVSRPGADRPHRRTSSG